MLALAVGCSDSVWDDVEAAQRLATFDAYYVCKAAGIFWDQGFFHWITLHPEYMDNYRAQRRERGLPDCYEIIAPPINEVGTHWQHPADRRVSYRWPGMSSSGSSGLYAAKVALDDGCDGVVLAGIPMIREGNHFTRGKPWVQRDCFMDGWAQALPVIKGKVRSISGWTAETLGVPDAEWLAEVARCGADATGVMP